jgi:hypothetical protein
LTLGGHVVRRAALLCGQECSIILLWRKVKRSRVRGAVDLEVDEGRLAEPFGTAEVAQSDATVHVDEDVGGLQIPVKDAPVLESLECQKLSKRQVS